MTSDSFDEQVAGLATLGEPGRRSLYRYVVSQARSVSREQAANGVGVSGHRPHHAPLPHASGRTV